MFNISKAQYTIRSDAGQIRVHPGILWKERPLPPRRQCTIPAKHWQPVGSRWSASCQFTRRCSRSQSAPLLFPQAPLDICTMREQGPPRSTLSSSPRIFKVLSPKRSLAKVSTIFSSPGPFYHTYGGRNRFIVVLITKCQEDEAAPLLASSPTLCYPERPLPNLVR